MVSTPSKTHVHPNKSCIVAHFPVSAASHFQPEGVLSPFLKVISLHVSDPLIPLSGVGVAASLMDMLSTSCCWYSRRVEPDGAVAKGIATLKHLQRFKLGADGGLVESSAMFQPFEMR